MSKRYRFILYSVVIVTITTVFLVYYLNSNTEEYVTLANDEDDELNKYNRDDTKIFDLNFLYTINARGCENFDYLAVIIVTSYFGHVEARSSMRRAFGTEDLKDLRLRRVFLLGESKNDKFTTQEAIENEADRFGDIIQGNFQEAYRNLTYKHIMGLRWSSLFCDKVKYVIKMDDDIVVDIKKAVKYLNTTNFVTNNFIAGHILKNMTPKRDPANKWYVSPKEYSKTEYPPFVSGWFYCTTPKVAKNLVEIANRNNYFWIDDVFITGILAQQLKVTFVNLNRFFAVHAELMQCCLRDLPKIDCEFIVGPNGGDNNMFYEFNKLARECSTNNNCKERTESLDKTCVLEKTISVNNGSAVVEPYNLVG